MTDMDDNDIKAPRPVTANEVFAVFWLVIISLSVIGVAFATAPNPGHDFSAVSGGIAQGDLLYGSAADTLSALVKSATSTRYISNTGASNNPAWAQIDLSNGVTSTLPTANGGTGIAYFTAAGPTTARVYTFPDAAATVLTANAAVTVVQGGTGISSLVQGDTLYSSAANTLSALAKNTIATRYLSNTGTSNNPAWGRVDLTNGVSGTLPAANGGTGVAGFIVAGPSALHTYTFPDATTTVLTTNAAVTVAQGGTGVATLGDAGVLIGNATGAVQVTGAGTSGQVLTSNGAGVDPTFQTAAGGNDPRIIMDALTTGEQFNVTANSTTLTEATNLSQTLAAGTYTFRYYVIWITNDATNGIRLAVNYSGTNDAFVWRWCWTDVSAVASTAVPDQDAIIAAGQVGGCHASRAKSTTTRGALLSADTVNQAMMAKIEGVFVATGSGDLELWAGNETAGAGDFASLMIGTSVEIYKTK